MQTGGLLRFAALKRPETRCNLLGTSRSNQLIRTRRELICAAQAKVRIYFMSSSFCWLSTLVPFFCIHFHWFGHSPSQTTDATPASVPQGKLSSVLLALALSGATTGTLLDGIHSRVQVLVYDSAPLVVGGLHTSMWVPPLLAAFYFVMGGFVIFFDSSMASDPTTRGAVKGASLTKMVLSFGTLAAMLEFSAILYTSDVESSSICIVLALCAAINYLIFDSTKQGLALALLCAIGAPLLELVLMQSLHLWHYPLGDLHTNVAGGIDRWVPFCYFFYTPALSNLARYLWKTLWENNDRFLR